MILNQDHARLGDLFNVPSQYALPGTDLPTMCFHPFFFLQKGGNGTMRFQLEGENKVIKQKTFK